MADTTEKVIFRIELDQSKAIKESADLSKEIKNLTDANKDLKKAGKETGIQYTENDALIRSLKDQKKQLNLTIDQSIKAFNAEKGSLVQMRAELKFLELQYSDLSDEQKKAADGQDMAKGIKERTDALKKEESAMGDNRRNMGNYKDALLDASGSLNIFGLNIGQVRENLIKAKEGIDIAKAGFSGFDGVIKASAIGVLILLLGGVISAFEKFDPLMDKAQQIFAGLNAVVDVFVERLTRIGRGLVAITEGNFKEGIDQIRNSFDSMGESMVKAAKQGSELEKSLQQIQDRQRGQDIANAETEAQVSRLILQSKNRTLSEKDRLAFLDQAAKIERANFNEREKLVNDELAKKTEKVMMKGQLSKKELDLLVRGTLDEQAEAVKRGTISDGELNKLKDLQIKKIGFTQDSINLEEKIQNRSDAIKDQAAQKEAQRQAKAQKDIEDTKKAQQKLFDDMAKLQKDNADQREQFFNESNKLVDDSFNKQSTELLTKLTNDQITQAQFDSQNLAIQLANQEAQLENYRIFGKNTTDIELDIAKTKLDIRKQTADDTKKIQDAAIKTEQANQKAIANIVAGAAQLFGEQTAAFKVLSIAQATINTYSAATAALAPPPLGLGPIFGPIAAVVAIASGLGNVAKIQGVTIGGAAAGGGDFMTRGPALLLVGDNPGGVERITVDPVSGVGQTRIAPGGNLVAMAGGGSINDFGGYAERNQTAEKIEIDYERLSNAIASRFESLPAPIVRTVDLEKVSKDRGKMVAISQLG